MRFCIYHLAFFGLDETAIFYLFGLEVVNANGDRISMFWNQQLFFRFVLKPEFLEKRYGLILDYGIGQPVFGLVKKHKSKSLASVVEQQVLIKPVGFTQYAFEIITVNGFPEILFGNGNPHFYPFTFGQYNRNINQPQWVF
jgi:hypothetical protein